MRNNSVLKHYIFPQDEELLRFLQDVQLVPGGNRHDFELVFTFMENKYISDRVLTKKYTYDGKGRIKIAKGCEIHWKLGDFTKKTVKKSQKSKKKPKFEVENSDKFSFFSYFQTTRSGNEDSSEDSEREYLQMIEDDEEIGQAFREEVIPNALFYYMGLREEESEEEEGSGEELETIEERE